MSKSDIVTEANFDELISMIEAARIRAWQAVNFEMVSLYWGIGQWILGKMQEAAWGSKVVEKAAACLAEKRPDLGSFSRRTLYRIAEFYNTYKDDEIVTPLVTQITWTNHLVILSRAKSPDERRFYIEKCASEHCSKRDLERLFDSSYYERRRIGEAAPASALVAQPVRAVVPDVYSLEFLDLPERHREATLRDAIVSLGQIDFYLEALDRDVRNPDENPSVGVILCTDKDDSVVEYALSRSMSPTMVASYQLVLPDKEILQNRLRQITELVLEENQISELPCSEEDEKYAK